MEVVGSSLYKVFLKRIDPGKELVYIDEHFATNPHDNAGLSHTIGGNVFSL